MKFFIKCYLLLGLCLSINVFGQIHRNENFLSDSAKNNLNSTLKVSEELLSFPLQFVLNDNRGVLFDNHFNVLQYYGADFKQDFSIRKYYLQKKINSNIQLALLNIRPKSEDKVITSIRKYLGVSKNIFALILALISLSKYH